jgi:hypothetical protein
VIRQEDTGDTVQEKITSLYVLRRRIINKCEGSFFTLLVESLGGGIGLPDVLPAQDKGI